MLFIIILYQYEQWYFVEWLNYDFVHTGSLPEIGELMDWGSSTS